MHRYFKLSFLLVLLQSCVVQAQEPAREFEAMLASFDSISGEFTQRIYAENGDLIDAQQGRMSMQKPRQIHWVTLNPRQVMICDGENIYLYDPDLEQVVVRPWREDPTQNPVSLFTSSVDLQNWFEISRVEGGFLLEPRDGDSLISAIAVQVSTDDRPQGFRVSDKAGQVSEVSFTNISFDQPLDASLFEFEPPEGVDIILDD